MIEEEARVASIESGQVWVEKIRQSACGSCSQPCTTKGVADYLGKATVKLAVTSTLELQAGDRVIVGIPEDALLKGYFAMYLLPLFGLLAGAMLGKTFGPVLFPIAADGAAALGGALGMVIAIALLKYTRLIARSTPQPVVVRKLA